VASTISGTSFPSGWHEDFRQPTFSTKKWIWIYFYKI
jgi:hypothetical protein